MTKLKWDGEPYHEPDPARVQQTNDFIEPDKAVRSVTKFARPDRLTAIKERMKEMKARKLAREKATKAVQKKARLEAAAKVARLLRR